MSVAAKQMQTLSLRQSALPITGAATDYDPLLERIGSARFVLIGEASHGTHEFYEQRAVITKRLIQEKGFDAVAVEADWPDAYRINRYVRGVDDGGAAVDALAGFKRFPTWMWRDTVVLDFIGWLHDYNANRPANRHVGFYGLDLYGLGASIEAVLTYLDQVDPEAAKRARFRYGCFERFHENPEEYGYAANFNLSQKCEDEAVQQLVEMQQHAAKYTRNDGKLPQDEAFFAEQNARVVKNAEEYYRSMFREHVNSWNLRDQHMAGTLDALAAHLSRDGSPAKLILWEHNSHLGDARATELGEGGELNLGQLARARYGDRAVLVGLFTNTGTVTAASEWDAPPERKRVRPALADSYEGLFHQLGVGNFMLTFHAGVASELERRRLERAIGVIYLPETERISHYFYADLTHQFDAVIHFDETRALEPLERTPQWETGEPPETYPTGI